MRCNSTLSGTRYIMPSAATVNTSKRFHWIAENITSVVFFKFLQYMVWFDDVFFTVSISDFKVNGNTLMHNIVSNY